MPYAIVKTTTATPGSSSRGKKISPPAVFAENAAQNDEEDRRGLSRP